MTRPTCKTCRYWQEVDPACHLKAPTLDLSSSARFAVWPTTLEQDWCGEHKPTAPVSKKINTNKAWFKTHDEVPAGGTRALYMDAECKNSHAFPIRQNPDGTWPDIYAALETAEPGYAEYEEESVRDDS